MPKSGAVSGGVILRAVGSTTWMRPMDRFRLVSLHRDTGIRQSSKRSRAPLVRKRTDLPVSHPKNAFGRSSYAFARKKILFRANSALLLLLNETERAVGVDHRH